MANNKKRLVIPNSSAAIQLTRRLKDKFEIFAETPEECTNLFVKNNADFVLLSPYEYAKKSDFLNLSIIPHLSITLTDTSKDSILLFSKNISKISNVSYRKGYPYESYLAKIIFSENYNIKLSFNEFEEDIEEALNKVDALLLTGDEAIENAENPSVGLLLAEEWSLMTNLPYVSYLLVTRTEDVNSEDISYIKNAFQNPKEDENQDENGLISEIIQGEDDYFEQFEDEEYNYTFEFSEDQKKSLEEYFNFLFSYSLIENIPDINLLD